MRAHVIANSFYRPLMEDDGFAFVASNRSGIYPSKRSTGIYDRELVCEECERLFSPWDLYGKQFLLDRNWDSEEPFPDRGEPLARIVHDYDYRKLKLFFLSVLWRSAVSTQPFFKRVDLGPHLDSLHSLLAKQIPGTKDDFAVNIARFEPTGARDVDPQYGFLNPGKTRYGTVNYIQFWLSAFAVIVKVDRRPAIEPLKTFCLAPDPPLVIILRDFSHSKELAAQRRLVRKMFGTN